MRLFSLLVLTMATLLLVSAQAADADSRATPKQAVLMGEAIYALYVDDPITSMSVISAIRAKGLTRDQQVDLMLMEGGLALENGMPRLAEQRLQANYDVSNSEPLALFWLARLNFAQQRQRAGLDAYQAMIKAAKNANESIEDRVPLTHWYALNYRAAMAAAFYRDYPDADYVAAIPKEHIYHQYLAYNQAVDATGQGDAATALSILQGVESSLTVQLSGVATDRLFDWPNGWSANQDESVTQHEIRGLLNQTYLTHGQLLLGEGRFTDALDVFAQISGDSALRDEALLHFGWGLARGDNWPMAMGVWDALAKQPASLFTLQAIHALALGYAQQGGQVQAHAQLTRLSAQLAHAVSSLDELSSRIVLPGYWLAMAQQVRQVNNPNRENAALQASKTLSNDGDALSNLWPIAHHDLLVALILGEHVEQDPLLQLDTVYDLQSQLDKQLITLQRYEVMLGERNQTHQHRVATLTQSAHDQQLNQLYQRLNDLQDIQRAATLSIAEQSNDERYEAGLSTYADASQLGWLSRLSRAEKRLQRLSAERTMRPAYQTRLSRIKGVLLWQLSEQSNTAQWKIQQALNDASAQYQAARARHSRFEALLNVDDVTSRQRTRIDALTERVKQQSTAAQTLIDQLESQLTTHAMSAIAERKQYLIQQQHRSKLAMLQLQDRWDANRNETPSTPSDETDNKRAINE